MTPRETKVAENLARRAAMRRFGLMLTKSPRRDRLAPDYGLFALIDPETGEAINPPLGRFIHSWDLAAVEAYLEKPHAAQNNNPTTRKRKPDRSKP
jgi:hypothetical protein